MTQVKMAIVLSMLCLAFGCATTQPLSDAQRRAIRSVSVAKNVAILGRPQGIASSADGRLMLLGPLGFAVIAGVEYEAALEREKFQKFLYDHIDLKEIVRQEFIARLSLLRAFPAIVAEGGDANFDLTIQSYGLAPGFSMSLVDKPLRPDLRLAAKLSTVDGKILWQNSAYSAGTNSEIKAYKIEDIYDDPPRSREGFRRAAQFVVNELLNDLGGVPASAGSSTSVPQSVVGAAPAPAPARAPAAQGAPAAVRPVNLRDLEGLLPPAGSGK